ncbi:SET domain-containing protein [Melanomma pulvis-pyrius CBS 109.77]|uniref:SET domain-containing protein n=1 Tax=Melanomma pulvis-pyrius CBS 109.77 TaxID=1314802 RepID=A0A6A6WU27_9PLEO|nr:SET domain-containing protein [Melanomma pulvis-pyrius CBS 109.77]
MQTGPAAPPAFEIRSTPHSGRAVFAARDIPAHALIWRSEDLALSVLLREYRREVCGQCFSYAHGRDLQIRDAGVGFVFCTETCQDQWREDTGEVGVEAWTVVEALVKRRSKEDSMMVDVGLPRPRKEDIERAWEVALVQARLIKVARQGDWDTPSGGVGSDAEASVQVTKQHKRALQKALQQPISPDVMSFCVSGILFLYNSPLDLEQVLHLESDSTPYLNAGDLLAFTRSYLHLLAILPLPLVRFLTPENLFLLSTRDSHNAFGIRSLEDDGAEFFGYGCWPKASYFNHSCAPSVVKTRVGRTWGFFAQRDLKMGEELCITYLSGEERALERIGRMGILRGNWGFECGCVRCAVG